MRIAVTGAAGFLGLNLVERLAATGHEVLALDRGFSAHVAPVLDRLGVGKAVVDVLDADGLETALRGFGPEGLFHGATLTADLTRERGAFSDILAVNVVGTGNVLQAARHAGASRVVVASSSAVYGEAVFAAPARERDPARPVTLYGITKLAAEQAALRFASIHGCDVRIVRIAAVFGPYEHRSGARDVMSPQHQIAQHALAGREAVLPEGGARDWIGATHVADIVASLIRLPDVPYPVFNVAAADCWLPCLFAQKVAAAFDGFSWRADTSDANVDYRDDLQRTRHALDTTRIRSLLGDDVLGSPASDAEMYARWSRANDEWFF